MAEPKKRLTKTRSGARRSHLSLKPLKLGICPKCKEPTYAHMVCAVCGTYKGIKVIELEKRKNSKK